MVPLERAVVPVGPTVSPSRLVRARSGVVPYSAREGVLEGFQRWVMAPGAFAGCVIGGCGGSGKTRLAVEMCARTESKRWLCGVLSKIEDPAALEELGLAPTARLVVVDYAESRVEQLNALLPLLAASATVQCPVRVLLLVRTPPKHTGDWREALQNNGDWLDAVLDKFDTSVLEEMPLDRSERVSLFSAAAHAFAARAEGAVAPQDPPEVLEQDAFASPLLVVIGAYLAVHGSPDLPSSTAELLDELLTHEQHHWSETAGGLFDHDEVLPRRVVALATLAGAENEGSAVELLRLLPDFSNTDTERRGRIARWVNNAYPGPRFWNPLEPDLLGERLVFDTLTSQPKVLSGVLASDDPVSIVRPLDVYARAAVDYREFAHALQPILNRELRRLCEAAVAQAATADHDLIYGTSATTAAAAIDRVITAVELDSDAVGTAVSSMPPRADLILNSLAINLTAQRVEHLRRLAATNPAAYEPDLAGSLNNLSLRLPEAGRREEGLTAAEESVEVYRRLAATNPPAHEPNLATSLNNLSLHLHEAGRREGGLTAIEEAVEIRRRLAATNPAAYEPDLAGSLNNLSDRSNRAGQGGGAERAGPKSA